jgi:hypothetical protein
MLLTGAFAGPAALIPWAFWIEPARLVVRHDRLAIPRWRTGLRVAALSDLHVGSPGVGLDQLRNIVERTNREGPALVVLLGDFVTGGPGGRHDDSFVEPERIAAELKNLRAPLGTFAVLGNHDWWYDGGRVERALGGAGITVLENRAVRLAEGFWLGGIADLWTRRPDIAGTLQQVSDGEPVVLITHNPDVFPQVPERVSLMIAGHTHGGQVNLPFFGAPVTPSRRGYVSGRFVEQDRQLFVTTGVGTSIVAVRFRVPPEIAVLDLVPAPPDAAQN